MKSALELCIDAKAGRFIVMDGGIVYIQPLSGGDLEQVDADASPYLQNSKNMITGDRKTANDLVPIALCVDWKLSVQRQDGYTVWTVYSQKLPSLSAEGIAWLDAQANKPE
ncbi:hypothetical protein [Pseudomonas savastanoi]|uniref:hypothetical protein n=1 Tax=Pseudomonas savastanoi TaxID=29438 RepID=UPI0013C2DC4D|nr:hypothetical protein [Pseudomonas savastanoi]